MAQRFKSRTSWREKLEKKHPSHGKIVEIPEKMQKRFGTGTMLIPKPLDVDALIRKIPKGKLVTVTQIRDKLANNARADTACPLTTGIFIRLVAETAEEDLRAGKKRITPYWRVIKSDGGLNEKFPGGVDMQANRLKDEGHSIEISKGKKLRVKNFEKYLINL